MSDTPEAATKVRLMLIGGTRHREVIEVEPTTSTYVDLMTATTYYVRPFSYIKRDPAQPKSLLRATGYRAMALVHESIQDDPQAAFQHWQDAALDLLFAEFGKEVPAVEIAKRAAGQGSNGQGHANPEVA